jgi:hypothetical protein
MPVMPVMPVNFQLFHTWPIKIILVFKVFDDDSQFGI